MLTIKLIYSYALYKTKNDYKHTCTKQIPIMTSFNELEK